MQPSQRVETAMAVAINSFCKADSTPSVMAAFAMLSNPFMGSGDSFRNIVSVLLISWVIDLNDLFIE
jgi:hypothetical protein